MATNKILPFAGTSTNVLSDTDYAADAQRPAGVQPGIARAPLHNKTLKQTSLIAAAIGKVLADNGTTDVSDALTVDQMAALIRAGFGITRVLRRVITASGNYVPTPGMFACDVEIQGGGGGGGSGFGATAPNTSAGSGGGAGGYAKKLYTAAQIGASAAVIIGGGGAGGNPGQNIGANGGTSSFTPTGTGSPISGNLGSGGAFGPTSTTPDRGGSPGGGGQGSGGDVNIKGGEGGAGVMLSNTHAWSGAGGSSVFGAGGRLANEGLTGNDGVGYGAGGGGAAAAATSTAGGAGIQGVCVVTEYCGAV